MQRFLIWSLWLLAICLPVQLNAENRRYQIENDYLRRVFTVDESGLRTIELINKRAGKTLVPLNSAEFKIRISGGTHTTNTDKILTARDFRCADVKEAEIESGKGRTLVFVLMNMKYDMEVRVHYEIKDDDFYMRKHLEITSGRKVTLERVDVEAIGFKDAYQSYKCKEISSRKKFSWRPGLGQPLYTKGTATFWGVEFPASYNYVEGKIMFCGYQWGREIEPGQTYRTYKAVFGVGDDPELIGDAFLEYIDDIRIRPFRLQVQYNSWFDFKRKVDRESFLESANKVHEELVKKRGCRPFDAYVIDDGWQILEPSSTHDITKRAWPVNDKFDPDFATTLKTVHGLNSQLGLWLSPACLFGSHHMVKTYEKAGFESLGLGMSMCGPKYMPLLEDRLLELTRQGISYFKFDGLLGHVNIRVYELNGRGCPSMPQLGVEGFQPDDIRINSSKYDELKTYYIVAGTERLMQIFRKMHAVNPEIYLNITNGSYLSPWWLQYVDVVWMGNAGDEGGAGRTGQLVYRDGVYYEMFRTENLQFPLSAVFNHEPKKKKSEESEEEFRRYLFMCLSRGTGFLEIYIRPRELNDKDWDVLAEGLHWAYEYYPLFKRARMHGGNPREKEVYGYTAWDAEQGYVSIHNPGDTKCKYEFVMDKRMGLVPGEKKYGISSPFADSLKGLSASYMYGDRIFLELEPQEVRMIVFRTDE